MQRPARRIVLLFMILGLCLAIPFRPSLAQDPSPVPAQNATPDSATPGPVTATAEPDSLYCTVAGTVTSLATGEPLKKVVVALSAESSDGRHNPQTAVTDASGGFSISRVKPGRYFMTVARDGYLGQQYGQGQDHGDGHGAVLSLAAGQKMTDLIFRLQKTAVITGRVVDENGDPIIGASVEVLRRKVVNGSHKLEPVGSENTDDQGTYRVFGLPPGHYCIRVNPSGRRGTFTISSDDDQPEPADPMSDYPVTYFPGTTDSARASAIDVKAGDEIPRIDFFLSPQAASKTYRIRGHVTNALGGQTEGSITVMAVAHNSEETTPFGRFLTQPDPKTARFTIEGLAPGSYTILAMSFGGAHPHSATQEVDITNSDVDSVSLVLTHGADITGLVTFDGHTAAVSENLTVTLESRNPDTAFAGANQAQVKPDGSFLLRETGDGSYSIRVFSNCRECYLKSATAGGVDLLAQHITVTAGSGPANLELVYSSNTGKAAGAVTGDDGLPLPGAYVVLVADAEARRDAEDLKSATTDQYGRFEIVGVAPGRYKALAWAKADSDVNSDLEFIKPFADKAESFEIEAGSTVTLTLKALPANETN
jgi:protocatechuate 3,4-dioxygenase beta subunit